MTVTGIGACRTVVLAGFGNSGALLLTVVGCKGGRGQRCAGKGQHARNRQMHHGTLFAHLR